MKFKDYSIFGLLEGASEIEVDQAYFRLKAQYSEDRFKEGEEGNAASRRLMALEDAYTEYKDDLRANMKKETAAAAEFSYGGTADYAHIDALIKEGRLEEAQKLLDDMQSRTGEWHYLQAIVFYKRSWYGESRKQLQLALALEPENPKFRAAAEKMELFLGNIRVEDNMNPQKNSGIYSEGYDPNQNSACNNAPCCYPICCC